MSLKSLREEARLSQCELGSRLHEAMPDSGVEPEYFQPRISSYESGRNRIPLPVAVAITKILNAELKARRSKVVATVEGLLPEPEDRSKKRATKKKPRR